MSTTTATRAERTVTDWLVEPATAHERAAKYNARLARYGLTEGWVTVATTGATRLVNLDEVGLRKVLLHEVTATFTPVALPGGFELAACVLHGPEGNVVSRVPGFEGELPESLWTASATCDHCQAVRNRTETFVVRDADGALKRVGRQCVAPYLGLSAACLLYVTEAGGGLLDEDEGVRQAAGAADVTRYLAACVSCIRGAGWRPASDYDSTKASALTLVYKDTDDITDADHAKAAAIVDWIKALEPRSEFDRNLKAAVEYGVITHRTTGLLAYAPVGYDKAIQATAEKAASLNEHLSTVGAKVTVAFRVTRYTSLGSYTYNGPERYRITGRDAEGRTIQLVTSTDTAAFAALPAEVTAETEPVTLTGTVKAHEVYEGRKITVLTRCKPV